LKSKIILVALILLTSFSGYSQTGPNAWFEFELSKKIVKNLKAEFNPELRLTDGFRMGSYILEGGLSYKLHSLLTIAGYYRFENEYNYREKRKIYEWEPSNRLAFDAKTGFKLDRLDFQFRLRYTNGTDSEQNAERASYFRYRAKVDYNIKGNKLLPFASAETFHDLIAKEIEKTRYTIGAAYPINKKNEASLFYRLQDYSNNKESIHIIGIGYSLKL
jgi:hypothetical protein